LPSLAVGETRVGEPCRDVLPDMKSGGGAFVDMCIMDLYVTHESILEAPRPFWTLR